MTGGVRIKPSTVGRGIAVVAAGDGAVVAYRAVLDLARRSFLPGGDAASTILAGHAVSSGNVLLRHWWLPLDSYWTSDILLNAVWTAWAGVSIDAAFAVPSLIVVGLAAVIGLLVRDSLSSAVQGWGWALAATIAVTPVLLPARVAAAFLLQGPMHVSTAFLVLVAFGLTSPSRSSRWRWAGTAILGLTILGDPSALLLGAIPIVLAGWAQATRRRWLRAAWAGTVLALAAVLLAVAGREASRAFGAFQFSPLQRSSSLDQWSTTIGLVPHLASMVVGALPSTPGAYRGPVVAQVSHTLLAVLFLVSAVAGIAGLLRRPLLLAEPTEGKSRWIDDACLFGIILDVVAFLIAARPPVDVNGVRYLLPGLAMAAVLVGRALTRLQIRFGRWAIGATAMTAVLVLAGGVAGYRDLIHARPPIPEPLSGAAQNRDRRTLVRWLEDRQMVEGVGGYWDASLLTVLSGERVKVRPVIASRGKLVPLAYLSDERWIADDHRPVTFIVCNPGSPWPGVTPEFAAYAFGPPTARYLVGGLQLLTWDHDLRPRLLGPPSAAVGDARP